MPPSATRPSDPPKYKLKGTVCFDTSHIHKAIYLGLSDTAKAFYKNLACTYLSTYGFAPPGRMTLKTPDSEPDKMVLHCVWKFKREKEAKALQAAVNDIRLAPPDPKFRKENHIHSVDLVSGPLALALQQRKTQDALDTVAVAGKRKRSPTPGDEQSKRRRTSVHAERRTLNGAPTRTKEQDDLRVEDTSSAAQGKVNQPTARTSSSSPGSSTPVDCDERGVLAAHSPNVAGTEHPVNAPVTIFSDDSTTGKFASPEPEVWGLPTLLPAPGPPAVATQLPAHPMAGPSPALSQSGSVFAGLSELDVDAMFSGPMVPSATAAASPLRTILGEQADQRDQALSRPLAPEAEGASDTEKTCALCIETETRKIQSDLADMRRLELAREEAERAHVARRGQPPDHDTQVAQLCDRMRDLRQRDELQMEELKSLLPIGYATRACGFSDTETSLCLAGAGTFKPESLEIPSVAQLPTGFRVPVSAVTMIASPAHLTQSRSEPDRSSSPIAISNARRLPGGSPFPSHVELFLTSLNSPATVHTRYYCY
ncbi:uncharacterized protein B0H18DRAFT_1106919 [Fomitopsis serialis]|uniref:uncharacterized protein n=1 Tax=Fomitopsis serialis TaxID=139415 RepID=UPI002007B3AF|nr:uncharacterized protein B0H18DRAFT_1106919 [Neoantrodia serialis]KAH9918494.1 hypothetical protein B0H18DRAFT_1106919 [Neoantrodia serialis]